MKTQVIAIGASAGGVEALKRILPAFKKPSRVSVLVVLHFPPDGPNLLPQIYQDLCEFEIKEAESGEQMKPETIYIAPPDYHLSAEENGTLSLSTEEQVNYSRPSIDVLMDSVAVSFRERGMGILLTGANHDGAQGMLRIHKNGGKTVVQDPSEAEFPTMPNSSLSLFKPNLILSLSKINEMISKIFGASHG